MVCSSYQCPLFCLSLTFIFILFRIACWSADGKELTSWLSVLLYAILIVCVPFPFCDW